MGIVACSQCNRAFELNMVACMREDREGRAYCLHCHPEQGLEPNYCGKCQAYPLNLCVCSPLEQGARRHASGANS